MRTTLSIAVGVISIAKAIARQNKPIFGKAVSELARESLPPLASRAERNGMPLLPVRRPDAVVTLDIVNALRDDADKPL
jgi:hypothetical protein